MSRVLSALAFTSLALVLAAARASAEPAPCPPFALLGVSVREASGTPIVGARVEVGSVAATTGEKGDATVCVRPIRYGLDHVAGETVVLEPATLASIGGTSTRAGRVPLNTGPGAVATIGRAQFDDQSSPQLARFFDQTPGAISNHTASSNPASPGVQTSPNLRGAGSTPAPPNGAARRSPWPAARRRGSATCSKRGPRPTARRC